MTNTRHIPAALADYSVKCLQDTSVYKMANALAPLKPVQKETDKYYIYSVAENFRNTNNIRTDKSVAREVGLTGLTQGSYILEEYAQKYLVSDRERANADPAVNPEMDAMEEITGNLLRERNLTCAKVFWTDTSFSTNHASLTAGTGQYDIDTTTSSPIEDADTALIAVLKATGKKVNGGVMGPNTAKILKRHSDILDRVKWSERGIVTEDILAVILGVGNVTVDETIYRTTDEGISATTDFIFDKRILYYHNETNPKLRSANLGITFSGLSGGLMPKTKRYRDENRNGDYIELSWMYDMRIVQSLSGYLLSDVHS